MIHYDCHAHIFEGVDCIPGARYVPQAPAPLDSWLRHLERHGLQGGVIVQVSFLGTDNSELCSALEKVGADNFAGVVVVAPNTQEAELDRLHALGVRGCRWNLVHGGSIPDLNDPVVKVFLQRIFARDMHIEVHLESPRLAGFISPLLAQGGKVVVDHLGLPSAVDPIDDPWLQALDQLTDMSRLYVKCSALYRTSFNTCRHAETLLSKLPPDHLIWGSDWPHTQYDSVINYDYVAGERHQCIVESDEKAVKNLYGF